MRHPIGRAVRGVSKKMDASLEDRVAATAEALLVAARDAGMTVTGDGRVKESDAAALLGYNPETLARKRASGSGPVSYGRGFAGARVSYRISDLAEWIESGREIYCDNPT
jgi:hypothetical protein